MEQQRQYGLEAALERALERLFTDSAARVGDEDSERADGNVPKEELRPARW